MLGFNFTLKWLKLKLHASKILKIKKKFYQSFVKKSWGFLRDIIEVDNAQVPSIKYELFVCLIGTETKRAKSESCEFTWQSFPEPWAVCSAFRSAALFCHFVITIDELLIQVLQLTQRLWQVIYDLWSLNSQWALILY